MDAPGTQGSQRDDGGTRCRSGTAPRCRRIIVRGVLEPMVRPAYCRRLRRRRGLDIRTFEVRGFARRSRFIVRKHTVIERAHHFPHCPAGRAARNGTGGLERVERRRPLPGPERDGAIMENPTRRCRFRRVVQHDGEELLESAPRGILVAACLQGRSGAAQVHPAPDSHGRAGNATPGDGVGVARHAVQQDDEQQSHIRCRGRSSMPIMRSPCTVVQRELAARSRRAERAGGR